MKPARAASIAASVLVLGATGALAVDSPQVAGDRGDKTVPSTAVIDAPTTALPTPSVASAPTTTVPAPTTTAAAPTTTVAGPPVDQVIDVGDAKPQRFYDAYLAASLADVETWWAQEFERLFGEPWRPLEGGIFAAYPERTSPIPGCGFPTTTYQEVSDYGAFYCPDGDFIAYDDGELGVIYELAERFSPSVVAVVLAHEFGHAVQFRSGDLDRDLATIYTEQQADCFSGAWAGRAWSGDSPGVAFGDEDIRTGLVALVAVADPIGSSVLEPGGHGAAFDRIGAFQEGFIGGIDNCVDLLDKPLPLLPNEFTASTEQVSDGDARFGWDSESIIGILYQDLSVYWPAQVAADGATMPTVTIRPVGDPRSDNCGNASRMISYGAVFCPQTNEVLFDEALGRVLYDDFGDFAVGYVIGLGWAEAVQVSLGSQLQGEPRALTSDCLVGAWIGTAIRNFDRGVGPSSTQPIERPMLVSPGDLDEAVRTALVVGDPGFADDREGSAFEKIAAMRRGVISGLPTCVAEITGA
jgi:predicted metalloprotease